MTHVEVRMTKGGQAPVRGYSSAATAYSSLPTADFTRHSSPSTSIRSRPLTFTTGKKLL